MGVPRSPTLRPGRGGFDSVAIRLGPYIDTSIILLLLTMIMLTINIISIHSVNNNDSNDASVAIRLGPWEAG